MQRLICCLAHWMACIQPFQIAYRHHSSKQGLLIFEQIFQPWLQYFGQDNYVEQPATQLFDRLNNLFWLTALEDRRDYRTNRGMNAGVS